MGITTPLTDTVSLPLGAGDVKMIDMAAVYAVFANGGRKAPPYAALGNPQFAKAISSIAATATGRRSSR